MRFASNKRRMAYASSVKRVSLAQVARNPSLLKARADQPDHSRWFVKLHAAMADAQQDYRVQETRNARGRFVWIDSPIFVLTDQNEIVPANQVYLRQEAKEVSEVRAKFVEVQRVLGSYSLIHSSLDTPLTLRSSSRAVHT